MIEIENDSLIKREIAGRENKDLRTSVIDTYFLWYQRDRQEIIPICHYNNGVMSKEDIKTVIKGLTNFIENDFTEEDIEKHNAEKIRAHHEYMYGDWEERNPKTPREKLSKSKVSSGFVYFIKEHFKGTVKIGKTKDIKDRSKQFGVKLPFEWDFIKVVESKDYNLTEKLLHDKFADKRVNGEWFDLSDEDVSRIENDGFDDLISQSIKGEGAVYA